MKHHAQNRIALPRKVISLARVACLAAAFMLAGNAAKAQISFTTAIDLALRHSPRVLMAQADVDKALGALSEARDVYIPTIVGGSGLGYSYGFPVGQPSIYNFKAQSLVFNYSQRDYIRAARSGLEAANYALMDARQATAEEAAVAYLSLDSDLQRAAALNDEGSYATKLVAIVQDRVDAGLDTAINLTGSRLNDAQIRLAKLRNEDGIEFDRARLARLTGLPEQGLLTESASIPVASTWGTPAAPSYSASSPGILAAYANADAKQKVAYGDARYEWRPQVAFGAQYNRFATYNNYSDYYRNFQQNNAEIGVEISLPLFDAAHRAKARQSAADAVHARREADMQRDQFLEGRLRLRHTSAELAAQSEIASLDQQLAQQQLDVLLVQLQAGNGNLSGPQMSPKDEQNARLAEREKFIAMLNSTLQLRQTQINLLRQSGQLEPWLKALAAPK